MKKKLVVLLVLCCMMLGVSGCATKKLAEKTVSKIEDLKDDAQEETDEASDETEETKKKATGIVFGSDEAEGYEGFEYLYEEVLMTESEKNEETGKMESKKVTIFLPVSDYASVSRDYAYADELGVDFHITLNPSFQYDDEDYLLSENLQYYLDEQYDEFYATEYKDLQISEVEEVSDNAVRATANYIRYYSYDDTYSPVYTTIYVVEIEKDLKVMIEVEVNLQGVTGKTDALLDEIESFYQFDVDWDRDVAQARIDDYVANDTSDTMTFSTGYLKFELPKGWDEDYSFDSDAYAPDGDYEFAECYIAIDREYDSEAKGTMEAWLEDLDVTKKYFEENFGEEIYNVDMTDMGETCLGKTIKVSCDDGSTNYVFYFAFSNDYMYSVTVGYTDNAVEDCVAIAEYILANGELRE